MSEVEDSLERIKKIENDLKALCPEYEDLLRVAAALMDNCTTLEKDAKKWEQELQLNSLLRYYASLPKILKAKGDPFNPEEFMKIVLGFECMALETYSVLTKSLSSVSASKAANAKHSRSGGSRDLAGKVQTIWASGKYTSRDICAEQECAALGMSFSAARKALRNTPNKT